MIRTIIGLVVGAALATSACSAVSLPDELGAEQVVQVSGAFAGPLTRAACADVAPEGLVIELSGAADARAVIAVEDGAITRLSFSSRSTPTIVARRPRSGNFTYDDGLLQFDRFSYSDSGQDPHRSVQLAGELPCH